MIELVYIAVYLVALAGVYAGLAKATHTWDLDEETPRKCVHIALGGSTLLFPWLFDSLWPVLVLGMSALGFMLWLRLMKPSPLQSVVHGVSRQSYGEMCFPIAVMLIFGLSQGNRLLYVIPILVLTLADAAGALVGVHLGRHRYQTEDGMKSIEGSLAVAGVTALCVGLPLGFVTNYSMVGIILVAAVVALLVMAIEAIAMQGFDNVFVPLLVYALLCVYADKTAGELLIRLLMLVLVLCLAMVWRYRTYLQHSALLGACVSLYVCWALGGWPWLLPPLIAAGAYVVLCPPGDAKLTPTHGMSALAAFISTALLWLMVSKSIGTGGLYVPFVYSIAVQISMMVLAYAHWKYPWTGLKCSSLAVASGALPMLLCMQWLSPSTLSWLVVLGLLLVCAMATVGFWFCEIRKDLNHQRGARWLVQWCLGSGLSGVGYILC